MKNRVFTVCSKHLSQDGQLSHHVYFVCRTRNTAFTKAHNHLKKLLARQMEFDKKNGHEVVYRIFESGTKVFLSEVIKNEHELSFKVLYTMVITGHTLHN